MSKKYFFCGSENVVHNSLRGRKHLYKCKDCGRQFVGGQRRDKAQVITDYIEGKQTMEQLAEKYKVSSKTIADYLDGVERLREHGVKIYGVVCDGMYGLQKQLSIRYPVQMCQFHQQMIERRYLADDPELDASYCKAYGRNSDVSFRNGYL